MAETNPNDTQRPQVTDEQKSAIWAGIAKIYSLLPRWAQIILLIIALVLGAYGTLSLTSCSNITPEQIDKAEIIIGILTNENTK